MTQQEARALVRKECRRRKHKWGAQNADALKQMRAELAFLNEHPSIARRLGMSAYATRIEIAGMGGAYVNIRRGPRGRSASMRYD